MRQDVVSSPLKVGLSAGALVICTWGSLPRSGWFASSMLFGHNLVAAPVGAVIQIAVAMLSVVGPHRSAQATLLALQPAWGGLLVRLHSADVGWVFTLVSPKPACSRPEVL